MSNEHMRQYVVADLPESDSEEAMERIALFHADGTPFSKPSASGITILTLDDILDDFTTGWRVPTDDGPEAYHNDPMCWTDGVTMHFRGDLIKVGNAGSGDEICGFTDEWAPAAVPSSNLSYVMGYRMTDGGSVKYALTGNDIDNGRLRWMFQPLAALDAGNYLRARTSDGLAYPTIFGSYPLASAVAS